MQSLDTKQAAAKIAELAQENPSASVVILEAEYTPLAAIHALLTSPYGFVAYWTIEVAPEGHIAVY